MEEGTSTKLKSVADVEIDATGRFKYVLIKVIDDSGGGVYKYVVRGFDWANYHGKFCNSSASLGKRAGKVLIFWSFGHFTGKTDLKFDSLSFLTLITLKWTMLL